jgi:transcriptional regulator with XRE-family HTH domain
LKLKITDFDVYGKIKHQTQLFLHDGGQHTMIELKTFEDVFGYRLRELRGKLTQKQLADILDTDPQTVQRWESGKLIPQASTRAYIAEKLKVAETSLFLDPDLTKPSDEQILAKITEKFGEKPFTGDQECESGYAATSWASGTYSYSLEGNVLDICSSGDMGTGLCWDLE